MKTINAKIFAYFLFILMSVSACADQYIPVRDSVSDMINSIGVAMMKVDGTITLQLRAESDDGSVGDAYFEYPPSDPEYQNIIDHLGGIEAGQQKPVPPWPEETTAEQSRIDPN